MPGDPLRAKYIAEHFLEDAREVTSVRNMLGYTGSWQGKPVSVMGHGMGIPSMVLYGHELINDFGVKRIIRVGSLGATQRQVQMRDVILAQAAGTDSVTNAKRSAGYHMPTSASFPLLLKAWEQAKAQGLSVRVGNIITQYWSAALVGALISTLIVTRMQIRHFLLMIISLALLLTSWIVSCGDLETLGYLTYGYGFVCAALYNAFIAYGVSFVKQASSRNVSFILISGSAGAMFSPAISSMAEKIVGLQTVMYAIPVLYGVILLMLLVSNFGFKRQAEAALA
nr:hypothetical protein [Shewanella algae]